MPSQRADQRIAVPRHHRIALLALSLLVALGSAAVASPQPTAGASAPKVAIIMGPAGTRTRANRDWARAALREARKYTPNVVKVFTPNATWSRAKAAMDGASVVVYIGVGLGYPSVTTSKRKPGRQDGFALNPVAGVDNKTRRFYGESYVRTVSLAPNAVVLLHHADYASGKPPAGYRQPSRRVARSRIDHYGAGFLAAGASAVIAEYSASPAYYIRAIFTRNASLRTIWKGAPTFHHHVISFTSRLTPGASGLLDPVHRRSGYTRSIVGRLGTRTTAVRLEPTSCGSSLQARVDAAASGGTLNLIGCTYPAGATITKPLTIVGARVLVPSNQRGLIVKASGVTIDSVVLSGPQATTYRENEVGILSVGSISNLVVRNSTIKTFGNSGIWLGPSTNSRITSTTIEDVVYAGIMLISASGARVDGNAVRRIGVHGAAANQDNAYGIGVSNLGGTLSTDVIVDGNTVESVPTWHGLDTHAGRRITFSNNTVNGAPRALFITSDSYGRNAGSVTATGNKFLSPSPATSNLVTVTTYAVAGATITGNTAKGWGGASFFEDYQNRSTGLVVSGNGVTP